MFCFTYRKHLREYVGHFFRNPICRLCGAGAWPPGVRGSVAASARHVCLVAVVVRVPVVSMVKFHRRTFRYESCVAVSRDSCHVHGFENGGREHVENPDSHLSQPVAISLGKPYMSGLSRNGFCRYFDFCVQNISTGNQKIKKVPTTNVFYSHNVLEFPRISHLVNCPLQ